MGLETATYLSGLTETWPLAGDNKSQGDDHLRLIKDVLKNTFPSADKAFYFPKTEAISGTLVLDATDQNNIVIVDTSGGNVAVTLPSGFTTTEKGWTCEIVKNTADANAVIVSPASGTIASKVGSTATIRVGILNEPARFLWSGTGWICSKPGATIGSVESFDGGTTPYGYLDQAGATYSSTDYAELFAVLATSTLRDRRGRTDIADGTGTGLTARVAGTNYGAETVVLVTANLPAYTPAGTIVSTLSLSSVANAILWESGAGTQSGSGGVANSVSALTGTVASTFTGTAQGGSSTAVAIMPPSIGVKKIIRAC